MADADDKERRRTKDKHRDPEDEHRGDDPGPIEVGPVASISVELDPGPIELDDVVYAPPPEDLG
jgi:hypothetical protein